MELGKTLGSPRRLESLGYKTRRAKGLQELAPPTTLEITLTQKTHD